MLKHFHEKCYIFTISNSLIIMKNPLFLDIVASLTKNCFSKKSKQTRLNERPQSFFFKVKRILHCSAAIDKSSVSDVTIFRYHTRSGQKIWTLVYQYTCYFPTDFYKIWLFGIHRSSSVTWCQKIQKNPESGKNLD